VPAKKVTRFVFLKEKILVNVVFSLVSAETFNSLVDATSFVPYDPSQEPLFPPELTLSPLLDQQRLVFRCYKLAILFFNSIYLNTQISFYLVSNSILDGVELVDTFYVSLRLPIE
jgi:hypothetical protein